MLAALGATLLSVTASAQTVQPPVPSVVPPPAPPPPPPPPKIEVPVVPKLDAPTPPPKAKTSSRLSFADRVTACLTDATAGNLAPGERAGYSRACASQY